MTPRLLFGKHIGKPITEVPSGYLVWIVEDYDGADWLLIDACKAELSARLKLDWSPPDPLQHQLDRLTTDHQFLADLLFMSQICKGNPIILESYIHNPALLYEELKLLRLVQSPDG